MELNIRHSSIRNSDIFGAFIPEHDPAIWLAEISGWGLELSEIEVYPVPESIQSIEMAGVFVRFEKKCPFPERVQFPYQRIQKKLYIPNDAELFPAFLESELDKALLWDCYLFHPHIGLVGFEQPNQIDLNSLLQIGPEIAERWDMGQDGNKPFIPLHHIQVPPQEADELLDQLEKEMDRKSLKDIPGLDEEKSLSESLDDLQKEGWKGALSAAKRLREFFSDDDTHSSNTQPGFFDKVENWLEEKINDLDARRKRELDRLMDLFDKDSDEALRYAIPLDSPYHSRGKAPPSWKLGARSIDFNLGGLGGGGLVDSWDVSQHYHALRQRYISAAEKAMVDGKYRRAAYIYAHLLGDFTAAAKALKEGKFYREAARLYLKHLNNKRAAAECLEAGGLYLEAIPLLIELNMKEKAGDLYRIMEKHAEADACYEEVVSGALKNQRYFIAAEIIRDKLNQSDRAAETLLKGWKVGQRKEHCLKAYFDLIEASSEKELAQEVKWVYEQETDSRQKSRFLNILIDLNRKYQRNEALLSGSREIAYEIVSQEVLRNQPHALHKLKHFLPDDKLIQSDTSRYRFLLKQKAEKAKEVPLNLDPTVYWLQAIPFKGQFVAIGLKEYQLHVVRANWYGNQEYYVWPYTLAVTDLSRFSLLANPFASDTVLIHAHNVAGTEGMMDYVFPKNKYFPYELRIKSPNYLAHSQQGALQVEPLGFGINKAGEMVSVNRLNHAIDLTTRRFDEATKKQLMCFQEADSTLYLESEGPVSQIFQRQGWYYLVHGEYIICITEVGRTRLVVIPEAIRQFCMSMPYAPFKLVIQTDKGARLYELGVQTEGEYSGQVVPVCDYFGEGQMENMQLITRNHLLYNVENIIYLWRLEKENPVLFTSQAYSGKIASLLPAKPGQFAILDRNGEISIEKLFD